MSAFTAAAMAAMAGLQLAQGYKKSQAYQVQGKYREEASRINFLLAEYQAEDAIRRGEESVNLFEEKVSQIVGSQRAGFAAQGIEVDSGSAAAIQEDTRRIQEQESIRIRANAYRESFGYKSQAILEGLTGNLSGLTSRLSAQGAQQAGVLNAFSSGLQGLYEFNRES